jgi:hypothetical protein
VTNRYRDLQTEEKDLVNKSNLHFARAMFFTCMGGHAGLTTGFVFFAGWLQRKGS